MRCELSVNPGVGAVSGQWKCSVGESDQCGERVWRKMSWWMLGFTVEPCGGVVSLIPQQNKCDGPL